MATHYSAPRRTKSTNDKIVVPSWDNVWASFNAENQKTTIEAMAKDGWKLTGDAAKEIGLSKQGIFDQINSGRLEATKKKIFFDRKTREMTFVRPKLD